MRGMEDDLDGAAFLGCPTMGGGVHEINAPAIPSALTHDKNRLFISKTSSVICRPTFAVLLYISSWTNSTHLKSTNCAPFSSRLSGMFIFQARVKNIGGLRWWPRTRSFPGLYECTARPCAAYRYEIAGANHGWLYF